MLAWYYILRCGELLPGSCYFTLTADFACLSRERVARGSDKSLHEIHCLSVKPVSPLASKTEQKQCSRCSCIIDELQRDCGATVSVICANKKVRICNADQQRVNSYLSGATARPLRVLLT